MLKTFRRQRGFDHAIARKAPPCPTELMYLVRYFEVANRGRSISQGGWMPIPPSEIETVARLFDVTFERWELDALFRLDDVWRGVMMEETHTFDD